jgi:hypothetical protein
VSTLRLPDYRSKQKILYIDKTSPADLQKYGDSFFEDDRLADAIEFYEKANYEAGLQKIKAVAFERGDVMFFQQAAKVLRMDLKPADWNAVGQKAMTLKKYSFARIAFQKADNEEMLNSLQKIMQEEVEVKST